jgi:dienelactone hydrolase
MASRASVSYTCARPFVFRRRRAIRAAAAASSSHMSPLFDAGVPLESLPWGSDGDGAVSSRRFQYTAEDGTKTLEAYFAWDPTALSNSKGAGLPGVLVAHTAIGPQEVFIHSCCDALARLGYCAFALDMFGVGSCVFDKSERDALFGPLRLDRTKHARRVEAAYETLVEQPEVGTSADIFGIGFCLGGMAVLDLARLQSAKRLAGVVSFHGSLDRPKVKASRTATDTTTDTTTEKRKNTSCLLFHGTSDPFNPPAQVEECLAGLDEQKLPYELIEFPGVLHGFTRPEKIKPEDAEAGFGYDERAATKSWEMTKAFLDAGGRLQNCSAARS